MAGKATLDVQPLTGFQGGLIIGTAAAIAAYAFANRNTLWIEGGTFPGTDELTRQTNGKVVHFRSGRGSSSGRYPTL